MPRTTRSEVQGPTTAGKSPALRIRLLGPVQIDVDGAPLAVDTRKATALLAYLAVTGRTVSRDSLAALLWPDSDDVAARGALRRTLSVLNAALGGAGLEVDRSTVAMRDADADIDVRRFGDALAAARAHAHGPDDACQQCLGWLDGAVALARGDFMEGFALRDSEVFDEWQLAEAEAHRRELSGALERLARGRAAAGAWDAALIAGRRWLDLDPLHEPAHRLLMMVLARAGEPAAAIRQFRECVRILDAELGVVPLEQTTELYEAIRGGQLEPEGAVEPTGTSLGQARAGAIVAQGAPAAARDARAGPLVGRAGELSALIAAFDAIGTDGQFLLIEGEPGIGKTRLANALADVIRARGAVVLTARAYSGEGSIPYAPVAALLRGGLDRPGASERLAAVRPELLDIARLLMPLPLAAATGGPPPRPRPASIRLDDAPDAFGHARLIEALAEELTALVVGPVPGAIVLDDLDWADDSSVDVVAYLVRRLRGRPLAVVATWRPLDAPDEDRGRLLAAAERDGLATHLILDRLGRADVAELAGAILGDDATDSVVDTVFADSEGLPLYVAEALASAPRFGLIPGGVLPLLRARVGAVGEVAAQVLAAGAVIGRTFDFETARLASGRSEEETVGGLEELVRRGLIREVGLSGSDVAFDFTHGRLRDVAYESLGLARRRLLHRRVADALRARPAGDRQSGARWSRIALHETQAGRTVEAAEAHWRSGQEARRVYANREAREHLEAALALGHPKIAELHEALGEVLTLLGDYAGAIGHLEAAAALGERDREWAIEHRLALVHARRGDWARAASHVVGALEAAPDQPGIRSWLLADRSAIAGRSGDGEAAIGMAREALGLAEAADDGAGIARASQVLGALARGRGDLGGARAFLERALASSIAVDDLGLRVAALNTLGLVLGAIGDGARGIELIEEALVLCQRQGDRHRQAALENNLADLLRADGRREEAMDHLKRAIALFVEVGGQPGVLEPEIWKLVEW